jgi:hypothetical protein
MSPEELTAEVTRLAELVLDQGEAIAGLECRLGMHEQFVALVGQVARREPAQPPYEQAAAWQARRRTIHAVPAAADGAR